MVLSETLIKQIRETIELSHTGRYGCKGCILNGESFYFCEIYNAVLSTDCVAQKGILKNKEKTND